MKHPLESGWLYDEGRWLVIYYDKLSETQKQNLKAVEAALKTAPMGLVPDYWINQETMIVMLPKCTEDYQLQSASCSRKQISKDWEEHPILKIRMDSAKTNFFEAQCMMKICEDYSSGAEEIFQDMNDKSKRHGRHKKARLDHEQEEFEKQKFHKQKVVNMKEENSDKIARESKLNKIISTLPRLQAGNLLVTTSSQVPKVAEIMNEIEDANKISHIDEDVADDGETEPAKVSRPKPKIVNDQHIEPQIIVKQRYRKPPKKNTATATDPNTNDQENIDTVEPLDVSADRSKRIPLGTITNHATTSFHHTTQLQGLENITDMETGNAMVVALNENINSFHKKLNIVLGNQQAIITYHAKEKVMGTPAAAPNVNDDWDEKKLAMAAVLKKMNTLDLFLDFDQKLGQSSALRARMKKYLEEKMTMGNWQLTARSILNASMHLEVQQLYSGIGQPWKGVKKRALNATNLYPIMEGVVLQSTKAPKISISGKVQNVKDPVSQQTICSYFGSYVRSAKGRIDSQARRKKKNPDDIDVIEAMLFGLPPENQQSKAGNEGGSQFAEKSQTNGAEAGNASDEEESAEISTEDKTEEEPILQTTAKQMKLDGAKQRKAQDAFLTELMNSSSNTVQGIEHGEGGREDDISDGDGFDIKNDEVTSSNEDSDID